MKLVSCYPLHAERMVLSLKVKLKREELRENLDQSDLIRAFKLRWAKLKLGW